MTGCMEMPNAAFFGQTEAVDIAVSRWGPLTRSWNQSDGRCEIGLGGAGMPHVIIGSADNWLDAARDAGLLESEQEGQRVYQSKIDAFVGRYNA